MTVYGSYTDENGKVKLKKYAGNYKKTSSTIFDYIVPSATTQVNITGLDIVADGGLYEITIQGGVYDYLYMRVNNNSSSIYYDRYNVFRDSPLSTYLSAQTAFIACADTNIAKIYVGLYNGDSVRMFGEGQGIVSGQYSTFLTMGMSSTTTGNITSIQLFSGESQIQAGTRITVKKVYEEV